MNLEHLANNLNRQHHMSSNHLLAMRRVEFRILSLKQKVEMYGLNCILIPTAGRKIVDTQSVNPWGWW